MRSHFCGHFHLAEPTAITKVKNITLPENDVKMYLEKNNVQGDLWTLPPPPKRYKYS